MCGIVGFYSPNQYFQETHLKKMSNAIKHRGPDADGFFADGLIGLGHRRLSILDLSEKANQPMLSHDERFVMVFNGEIYNYRELAKQIPYKLKTTSDTEVILELFAKNYLNTIYQLNGMFAFALYDRIDKSLLLVRDRVGIKPLYYYWDEENLAFASELKSLLALPIVQEYDKTALSSYLHLGYIPAPSSAYKNIYKLEAGSWLKIDKDGIMKQQYWDISQKIYNKDTQKKLFLLNKEEDAKKHLEKLLESAVQYQLISDVPLGVFLSGGVDSSIVTAFASKQLPKGKLNTFSIVFNEAKHNEGEYARQVSKHLNTQHHELTASVKDAQDLIPQLIDVYDEPYADSSAIPTMLVSQLARKHVKVVLGGDGGDELFLGYGSYTWAKRLKEGFLGGIMRYPLGGIFSFSKSPSMQKASQLVRYPKQEEIFSHIFSQEQFLFSKKEIQNLFIETPLWALHTTPATPRKISPEEQQALFDAKYYLPDDLLVKIDRASMRYGLETRVPLLDHRIVEFAINLNTNLKKNGNVSKYLLKKVLYDHVPEKLFQRPKHGFSIPLAEWLKTDLRFLIDEYLSPENIQKTNLLKPEPIEQMKKAFFKGQSFYYNRLWALIMLQKFLLKAP